MTKGQNRAVTAAFLLMIFGFTIVSFVMPDKEFSEKENRVLQQMPKVGLESVLDGSFEKKYELYLKDQFFGRDQWIGAKTMVERLQGKQESNEVYFAKDGYLIEKHEKDFLPLLADSNLKYVGDFVEHWSEKYDSQHLKVIIVPNAVDILSEKLPAFAVNTAEAEYLEKVRQIIPKENLIDAETVLKAHQYEDIYYRTDHHWKTLGARYVYEAWAESIGLEYVPVTDYEIRTLTDEFYGTVEAKVNIEVSPDSIECYVPKEEVTYTLLYNHSEEKTSLYDEESLKTRDKYAVFFGGNQPVIEAKTEAKTGRKLLVLKDSYANCFLSFAMQDFEEIDILDLRYLNENLNDYLQDGDYTDILLLYNASGFAQDNSISKLTMASN